MLIKFCILLTVPGILSVGDNQFYGPQTFQNNNNNNANDNGNYRQAPVTRYVESDAPRAPPPAIISHKQALTNDGVFNYVFAADNGLKQGESIAPDGTRTGAYEYIDPSGKTIFVKYTAGKDGFKILEGDHIPQQPQQVEPIPEYQPPEYRKDYKQQGQMATKGKYKTDVEDYQQDDEQYRAPNQQQRPQNQQQRPQQYQPQNQRFNQPQKQQYAPQQSGQQQRGFGNQGRQNNEPNRAMLYNVEQRHNVNYRRYQDNGQPAGGEVDGSAQEAGPHSYGSGYNFEFKG